MNYFLQQVSTFFQWVLNFTLFSIGIVLTVAVLNTAFYIVALIPGLFTTDVVYTTFLEEIINFFLFFEFLSLVVKYFKNNFHFPLRYFIYIGITAIIRLIIVSHESSIDLFLWSSAILALVISLVLVVRYGKEPNSSERL
ncbi:MULTISPECIES: phosphate-starvation-inducible PsiE family protein [unclassified Veillonella]|uniref:phosphate-starvation-inducible PsiE family protein n=1 Tax=unclassified Veillonella TaxID=2630086 RepID=UPI001F0C9E52|nr:MULTISPECIES: phosphate-starvation-inducible PsiE family protein [unclassified Veillonella]